MISGDEGLWKGLMPLLLLLVSCDQCFVNPWTAAHQASLSFTIVHSLLKLMVIAWMKPAHYLILCCPLFLLPTIFPSIRVFPYQSALWIRWPKYWRFSFSISPSNKYSALISLGVTGLISLLSKGFLRIFSSAKVWKHQFFGTQPFWWSNLHICTRILEKAKLWLDGPPSSKWYLCF